MEPVTARPPRSKAPLRAVDPHPAQDITAEYVAAQDRLVEAEIQRRVAQELAALPAVKQPKPDFDIEGHMASVFSVLGFILSARALLGLVLAGAFVLGMYAMAKGDILSLVCLGVYGVITVPGLIHLELRRPAQA